ncbi:SRPBCC family protein [Ramlibacter tataouinensis]|nr:SRPBCC family protein [Ramlibacter tataouinensis]
MSRRPGPLLSVEETLVVRPPGGRALLTVAALAAGGWLLSSQMRKGRSSGSASTVEESIELDVPVSTAYNQFTQFEDFPQFMATVEEVKQLDDTHLHWRAVVAGKPKEWDAEITEQIPDKRIAWRSTDGVPNAGVVTFHKIGDNRTRVMLQMDYQPETLVEKVGDAVGGVKLTTKGNLKRFKNLLESRGFESGAWRGTVAQH